MSQTFELYEITNTVTGDNYIGVTGVGIKKRFDIHCRAKVQLSRLPLYRDILRYGRKVFSIRCLAVLGCRSYALEVERRAIQVYQPTYNKDPGGKGAPGGGDLIRHVEPFKRRIHSDATRQILRERACDSFDLFKKYMAMGPASISREVQCLDDGKMYPSIAAAARTYGVSKSALNELVRGQRGRKTVGGYRFAYANAERA